MAFDICSSAQEGPHGLLRRPSLCLLSAALGLFAGAAPASAATVKWFHLETNPALVAFFEQTAKDYEAANPGVTVEMQFLENEAYKAKLPTMLQSDEAPDIIYSWGGGVLDAQIESGFIKDITDMVDADYAARFSPAAWNAFQRDGRQYGIPALVSEVGIFYNKELVEKAGVDPQAFANWEDFLAGVRKIKEAGITPLLAGGADKWPLHFYWSYLAIRDGGKAAFEAATAGEGDGFAGETFVRAGELFGELVALEPFQPGFLGATWPDSAGQFGDGKGAMMLMGNWLPGTQLANAADGKGLAKDQIGFARFPAVPGGKGEEGDVLGGINGWLVTRDAPDEAVDFLTFFISAERQAKVAADGLLIPVIKGADAGIEDPINKRVAADIAASNYLQIFYDQALGPDVGRVVNDVSTEIAAGTMSPEDAAQAVQEAWEFNN